MAFLGHGFAALALAPWTKPSDTKLGVWIGGLGLCAYANDLAEGLAMVFVSSRPESLVFHVFCTLSVCGLVLGFGRSRGWSRASLAGGVLAVLSHPLLDAEPLRAAMVWAAGSRWPTRPISHVEALFPEIWILGSMATVSALLRSGSARSTVALWAVLVLGVALRLKFASSLLIGVALVGAFVKLEAHRGFRLGAKLMAPVALMAVLQVAAQGAALRGKALASHGRCRDAVPWFEFARQVPTRRGPTQPTLGLLLCSEELGDFATAFEMASFLAGRQPGSSVTQHVLNLLERHPEMSREPACRSVSDVNPGSEIWRRAQRMCSEKR